jgi:hypothetical protein
MDYLFDNTIQQLWNIGSSDDFDDLIWNQIMLEEGIIPEDDDFVDLEELEDKL